MFKEIYQSFLSEAGAKIQLTPRQRLQEHNLAIFFTRAAHAEKYCKYCNWPLDPEPPSISMQPPDGRCIVCIEMESLLWRRQYWQEIDRQATRRRKEND